MFPDTLSWTILIIGFYCGLIQLILSKSKRWKNYHHKSLEKHYQSGEMKTEYIIKIVKNYHRTRLIIKVFIIGAIIGLIISIFNLYNAWGSYSQYQFTFLALFQAIVVFIVIPSLYFMDSLMNTLRTFLIENNLLKEVPPPLSEHVGKDPAQKQKG